MEQQHTPPGHKPSAVNQIRSRLLLDLAMTCYKKKKKKNHTSNRSARTSHGNQ